jgi:uroporphyrin-III C-methyltransferase
VRDIVFKAQYAGLGNPAIIIVGEVVKLHLPHLQQQVQREMFRV